MIAAGFSTWILRTGSPFAPFGWNGIMAGGAIVFFAYIGFDAVTTAAEESRNPERDMSIGILGSLAICTLLYLAGVGDRDGHGRRSARSTGRAAGHGLP